MVNNNTAKSKTTGVISIWSDGENIGYYFISLKTVKHLNAFNWTEFLIYDYVITRVEEVEIHDNQSIRTNGYPISEWAPGVPMPNDDEDKNKISNTI